MTDPFARPRPPVLDMTPEGDFRGPPPAASRSWLDRALLRVGGAAALVALVAGGLAVAAVALVALSVLLPLALGAGAVAAVVLWWKLRQARRRMAQNGGAPPGGTRPGPAFWVVRR